MKTIATRPAMLLGLLLSLAIVNAACSSDDSDSSGSSGSSGSAGSDGDCETFTAGDGEPLDSLRIGVGPLLATPEDTEAAWDPFFSWLADELDVDYSLQATSDWAGISVALRNDQLDLAWMGPFGFVLAGCDSGAEAIATALYDGEPIYHAIVIGDPDLEIEQWPEDAEGLSISFTDSGSTSGWLIPHHWFAEQGIDPRSYFEYTEGATHAANVTAAANGTIDLATDFDRNLRAMIDEGIVEEGDVQIVWTSDPLPNDAIAVRNGFPEEQAEQIADILAAMTPEQAADVLPEHYTGFVPAEDDTYQPIFDAAVSMDVLDG